MHQPIFILGSHKSGSSLLRSLLDGHPELFVIPTESHFFQFTGLWVDYRLRFAWPKEMSHDEMINSLMELFRKKNTHNDPYADSIISGKFDVEAFAGFLKERDSSEDLCGLFQNYVKAIYYAFYSCDIGQDIRFVEKSVENAEFAYLIRKLFPSCFFVHIVRNPYASLVAIRKSKANKNYPYLRDYIFSILNSLESLFINKLVLDRYLVVRYENLLQDTQDVMRAVANFAQISFTESLLSPTVMGQNWGGNSTTDQKFEAISTKPLTNWQSEINDFEIELVNQYLGPVIEQLGYEKIFPGRKKYFPVRNEELKTYFKNRSLFWLAPVSSNSP